MRVVGWPCPAPGGQASEFALLAGEQHPRRLLIVPALFEEANRTRRLLAQVMRALASAGIGSVLPDLPGCGDSLAPLERQTLTSWRAAILAAAGHFAASHVLAVRGGALLAPALPGWAFEPLDGAAALRPLLRARLLATREAGGRETTEALLEAGRERGIELAGYRLGAAMVCEIEAAAPARDLRGVTLAETGGAALWLRSEPGEDAELATGLARILLEAIAP